MDRQTEQVIQINDTSVVNKTKREIPWKLIIMCVFFVAVFVLFTVFPPAQRMVYEAKDWLQGQGVYGIVILVLLVAIFVVPLGIPYSMFQMMFALVIPSYWLALLATVTAETLGAAIAFCISRYMFKEQMSAWMRKQKMFRGVEIVMSKNPKKFALVLRLTNFPLLIKNYALAIHESVGFGVYMITGFLGAVFNSAPQIYIFKQAEEFSELFQHKNNLMSTIFTLLTTFLSVVIILWVICYTRKLLNQIQLEIKTLQVIKVDQNKSVVVEKVIKYDIEMPGSPELADAEIAEQDEKQNIKLINAYKHTSDTNENEDIEAAAH